MDALPDYCPFCGARLHEDEPLEAHVENHAECREQFEAWRPERTGGTTRNRALGRLLRSGLVVAIVVIVLAYSLLISQQLLLGVLAAAVIYLVHRLTLDGFEL